MIQPRDRQATVAQLREVLAQLRDDDVVATAFTPAGNLPIFRDGEQIGVVEMAPADVPNPPPPSASLYLFFPDEPEATTAMGILPSRDA